MDSEIQDPESIDDLRPLDVPTRVYPKGPSLVPYEIGGLSATKLSRLCDAFRKGVFERARRQDPEMGAQTSRAIPAKPADQELGETGKEFNHYYRKYKGIWFDWYRVAKIFGPLESQQDHAMKKILFAGLRGHKEKIKDIKEAIKSLSRWIEMIEEDQE